MKTIELLIINPKWKRSEKPILLKISTLSVPITAAYKSFDCYLSHIRFSLIINSETPAIKVVF
jgi:hypothetical protein